MKRGSNLKKIAIYGAGVKGKSINYSFSIDDFCEYEIICFIDDNLDMIGTRLDNLDVYSFTGFLNCFNELEVYTVIWAINAHSEKGIVRKRTVTELCSKNGLTLKTILLPNEVLNKVEDNEWTGLFDYILNRKRGLFERKPNFRGLSNMVVLVTGAAGSIGSELCRQLMNLDIKQLVVLDNAETELNNLIIEMREIGKINFNFVLGDVRDEELMEKIFKDYLPNVVFHAAAFKHVPMMEIFPFNALDVNFFGTAVVANFAVKYKVQKFILVSTDKSVNPTSVMGATKRLAEMLVCSLIENGQTQFTVTRFGNVIGSRGSVIPLFHEQLKKGKPLQITSFEIERYFMTIPEAAELVLLASIGGFGNEIFVFDMGKPYRIYDLALRMIEFYGLELGKNASIEITGLRPGEKMYEELFSEKECYEDDNGSKLLKAKFIEVDSMTKELLFELLSTYKNYRFSNSLIKLKIKEIIPEYNFVENN